MLKDAIRALQTGFDTLPAKGVFEESAVWHISSLLVRCLIGVEFSLVGQLVFLMIGDQRVGLVVNVSRRDLM